MRDLVEAARAALPVVKAAAALGDRGAREAFTALEAALAAHEARPAVEWVPCNCSKNGCEQLAGTNGRTFVQPSGNIFYWLSGAAGCGTEPTLDLAKLAAETAAGVGR